MKSLFNRITVGMAAAAMVVAQVIMPVQAAFADSLANGNVTAQGNNGTLKVHELDTPSGTESNDPKVCSFNLEGFGFDPNQSGYIEFDVQGGDGPTGVSSGPYALNPSANANGDFATQYFNYSNGPTIVDGHYKATLYGKYTPGTGLLEDEKAKTKVFKVDCEAPTQSAPTATAEVIACTPESGLTDKVSVRVYNTDDATNASVTYSVVLGGQTKSITLADGANGNVEFGGLAAGTYSAVITGTDGTVTTNTVTVGECAVSPTPLAPTATIEAIACTPKSGLTDKVSVRVYNTDDATNATVTYSIVLGGQTKSITLADGANGNVEFGGLATGTYSAVVTGTDGTVTTNTVTVAECAVPTPTVCTVHDNTFIQPWTYNGDTYPVADASPAGTPGTATFTESGLHLITLNQESEAYGLIDAGNTPLVDVDIMNYTTYRDTSSTGYAQTLPAYILEVDKDGSPVTTGDHAYLFYEPYNNGIVTEGVWHTWDAINSGSAKWWMSGTGQALHTWNDFTSTILPDATVVAYGFNQGTYNAGANTYIKQMTFDCGVTTFGAPGKGGVTPEVPPVTPPVTPVTPTVPAAPVATTPGKGALPAELPETGATFNPLIVGLLTAVVTYGAVYFAQPKRRYE